MLDRISQIQRGICFFSYAKLKREMHESKRSIGDVMGNGEKRKKMRE